LGLILSSLSMQKANQHPVLLTIFSLALGTLFFSGHPKTWIEAKEKLFSPINLDQVDTIMSSLSDDERIAQMFVVKKEQDSDLQPGGYLLHSLDQKLEIKGKNSNLIPLVGLDLIQPNALSSALLSQQTISASNNLAASTEYLNTTAKALRDHGINFVIGPALDLYDNTENPYTNHQSFGSEPLEVAAQATRFIQSFRSNGILCVAGSFPGLGSSERGFEMAPPILFSKNNGFYQHEFIPFKKVINNGLQAVMISNALSPGLDSLSGEVASKSLEVNKVLASNLGYKGLVWADISKDGGNKDFNRTVTSQIKAGADVIIINDDLDKKIKEVNAAIKSGEISRQLIDEKTKRIIQSKLWIAKRKNHPKDSTATAIDLELKTRKQVENSITLLTNQNDIIPLKKLDTIKLAVLSISDNTQNDMPWLVNRYAPADVYTTDFKTLEKTYSALAEKQANYNLIIVSIDPETNLNKKRFGLSDHAQSVLDRLVYSKSVIFVWNGNPNALLNLDNANRYQAILNSYEPTDYTQDLVTQAIFGGRAISGSLKRKVKTLYEKGAGIATQKTRLGYGIPEEVGIDRKNLSQLDEIDDKGIEELAYPGCQVFFAKDGIVVVNNAYGHHRYEKKNRVKIDDIYDLASITKIAGSVAGLLTLNSEKKFDLDSNLSYYLGQSVDTSKYGALTMREILAHQAGLAPFVPFYSKTLSKGSPKYDVYSLAKSDVYPNRVAREFYIRKGYEDEMFSQILNHPLSAVKKYKYSDIGYYFALRIIEMQSQMAMDTFLERRIYKPLGLSLMTYKPLNKFDKNRITPTELDRNYRKQLIHGDVHDPGAAMLGGVGGHAGLFSNANDLGILMQMYLNGGEYGGEQFIDSTILADYIRCQYCDNNNRRGAGFDKPLRESGNGPSCGCTDKEAFGHQGFTGTVTWADPTENVVYVFLSNRVYPSASNRKLAEMDIRTNLQQAFYDAINKNREVAKNDSEN
jgi:beta-N-acetylhexosaminidase